MKERLASLSSHVSELEEDLDTARKDLIKSEEMNTKLQRDVREVSNNKNYRLVMKLNVWEVLFNDFFSPFVPCSPNYFQPLYYYISYIEKERVL